MNLSIRMTLIAACYTKAVRVRLGSPFWHIPDSQKRFIKRAAERAKELNLTAKAYIDLQFEHMPKAWCLSKFRLAYPPLAMLGTEKAYERVHKEAEDKRIEKKSPL